MPTDYQVLQSEFAQLEAEHRRLQADNQRLRAALDLALDLCAELAPYAPQLFPSRGVGEQMVANYERAKELAGPGQLAAEALKSGREE